MRIEEIVLKNAYLAIFGEEPEVGMKRWEIAKKVLEGFDSTKIDNLLAIEFILTVTNYTANDLNCPPSEARSLFTHAIQTLQEMLPWIPPEIDQGQMCAFEEMVFCGTRRGKTISPELLEDRLDGIKKRLIERQETFKQMAGSWMSNQELRKRSIRNRRNRIHLLLRM